MGTRTTRLATVKAPAGGNPGTGPGMFLVVTGTVEKAEIRFEGSKDFLDTALQAVEGLVDDIVAAEQD